VDLHAYREQAEAFRSDLDRAYYRHFAGHDAAFELEPIYRRHGGLFTRDAVLALQEQARTPTPGTDEHRRARMLWDFALEGHVGELTKSVQEELARREVSISLALPGETEPIGFRESTVRQANEPDADRRARLGWASTRCAARTYRALAVLPWTTRAFPPSGCCRASWRRSAGWESTRATSRASSSTWWEVAEAGRLLRTIWGDGLRLSAEEMLGELTGETLDFGILLADLGLD
jgi:hypothetical protein